MAALRALILALAAGAFAAAPAWAACSKPLRMVAEEWPPYTFHFGNEVLTGLDVELARAILDEAGCTLVADPLVPIVRRMVMFERGEIDLMLAASDTPERRRFARFTSAYRIERVGLFVLARDYERYRGLTGFDAHIALLAPTLGWYGKQYEQARPRIKAAGRLSTYSTVQQGMRMLAAQRAPMIMGDVAVLEYEARNQQLEVRQLPYVVLQAPVHMMLSRASTTAADVARINAAIARLEKNGSLKAIRAAYGVR